MQIIVKNVAVEVHQSIGLVKLYHGLLHQVYTIITKEIFGINGKLRLQILLKACNNLVGSHVLISTMLIFNAFLTMTKIDPLSLTITLQTTTVQKRIKDIQRINTKQQI